mmetsp:Transcript_14342/g.21057  ORF Transcript_14342/g.21057 Transcript_14342/m.21057 type:complete len:146 (-) Transcript_14342:335-772(-)
MWSNQHRNTTAHCLFRLFVHQDTYIIDSILCCMCVNPSPAKKSQTFIYLCFLFSSSSAAASAAFRFSTAASASSRLGIKLLSLTVLANHDRETIAVKRDRSCIPKLPNVYVKPDNNNDMPDFPNLFANTPMTSLPTYRLSKSRGT